MPFAQADDMTILFPISEGHPSVQSDLLSGWRQRSLPLKMSWQKTNPFLKKFLSRPLSYTLFPLVKKPKNNVFICLIFCANPIFLRILIMKEEVPRHKCVWRTNWG